MSDLPKSVEFHEEGPREGFQIESKVYPAAERAALIDALSQSRLPQIQVGSFVNPKAVPGMADTPAVFEAITRAPGIAYTALWLNEKGFRRAAEMPGITLNGTLMFYTTDRFSQRNNNCTAEEMRDRQRRMLAVYDEYGVPLVAANIITAFGCSYEGEVPLSRVTGIVDHIVDLCRETGRKLPVIYLADTVGRANPEEVRRRIGAVRERVPEAEIGVHLHDTRGLGGANLYAALQMGVRYIDSSIAGLGGCPFARHGNAQGAGNICTEDMVFMCEEMGISTGIDLDALIEAAQLAERIIGRRLTGKIMHYGRPAQLEDRA